jgi:hypothetical protein
MVKVALGGLAVRMAVNLPRVAYPRVIACWLLEARAESQVGREIVRET